MCRATWPLLNLFVHHHRVRVKKTTGTDMGVFYSHQAPRRVSQGSNAKQTGALLHVVSLRHFIQHQPVHLAKHIRRAARCHRETEQYPVQHT